MAKKIFTPILIFLTLISGTCLKTSTVSAASAKQIWTIPQLIAMKNEINIELTEVCNSDIACEDEFFFEHSRFDTAYKIVDGFRRSILLITAINPEESTIRVLFQDDSPMLNELFGGKRQAVLDELYIAWFSEQPNMYNSYYAVHGNYPEGMYHPLFAGSATANGANWFVPNTEVTLSINDAAVLYNVPYLIYFTMEADITNATGAYDYSDCMNSPAYETGMECRMVFDDEKGISFLPFLPGSESPVLAPDANEPNEDISSTSINTQESVLGKPSTTIEKGTNQSLNTLPKAPNTGFISFRNSTNKYINLPWWILALIIANIIVLIWLFVPIRRKSPKSPKKSKKSIDKKSRLR